MQNNIPAILIILICSIFTFMTTRNFYINKYESIINKNNNDVLVAENKLRKELEDKYIKASNEVNELESDYEKNNNKIDMEFDNNSTFIISDWLFDEQNKPKPDYSRVCNSATNSCSPEKAETGIILSVKDVRDSLSLAKEADRVLNELNLCKSFVEKIYESNQRRN